MLSVEHLVENVSMLKRNCNSSKDLEIISEKVVQSIFFYIYNNNFFI